MKNVYGIEPGEVFWAASDVGWVVGHSYIVYAPLLARRHHDPLRGQAGGHARCRRLLARDRAARRRRAVHRAHRVSRHQARGPARRAPAPPRPRSLPHALPRRRARRSRHRALGRAAPRRAGDRPLVADRDRLGRSPRTASVSACSRSSTDRRPSRCPATTCASSTSTRRELPRGETGAIVVKLPLPPGCLPTLWQNDDGFRSSYLTEFPGFYQTADAGFIDDDGYVYVMSRTDDIINVAGHRLSTGGMEEVLAAHPDVAECAVVGVADALKGQVPLGLVVLKAGVDAAARRDRARVVALVRDRIGPVASFKTAVVVEPPAQDALGQGPARHRATRSPTARSGGCRRPSRIPRPSTRSVRRCGSWGTRRRPWRPGQRPSVRAARRTRLRSTPAPRCRARDRSAPGSSPRRSKR